MAEKQADNLDTECGGDVVSGEASDSNDDEDEKSTNETELIRYD